MTISASARQDPPVVDGQQEHAEQGQPCEFDAGGDAMQPSWWREAVGHHVMATSFAATIAACAR